MGGSLFSLLGPTASRSLLLFGASGAIPVFVYGPLVDDPERRVAARRRPAHPLQHDVGPPARPGGRRHVRRGADGDHLHDRRRRGLPSELRSLAPTFRRCRSSPGAQFTSARRRRSSGCSARWCITAGAAAAAWCRPKRCSYAITLFVFGLIMPGHRQRRPRRRLRRRLPREHVARSAEARADGSLHRRGDLPAGDRRRLSILIVSALIRVAVLLSR